MEAEHGRVGEAECSGQQEQRVTESTLSPEPSQPRAPRPAHRSRGRLQTRSPRSPGLLLRFQQQQALAWQPSDAAGPSGGSFLSPSSPSSFLPSASSARGDQEHRVQSQTSQDPAERLSSPKRGEKKPQKPGKYVCSYCGRPCAKPSVLEKHIRSHTGERPYPCDPCGFSFKTKSNLYKHRKSHAHRIKAGLMSCREEHSLSTAEGSNVGEEPEEPTEGESTESEDETGQHRKTKDTSCQQRKALEASIRPEDSQAIKQRLALRLSERKRGPKASPDDPPSSSLSTSSSSLGPGSKGSTESGYFSGSGSTDLSQISPPSASAKTYAEIILGKYGRLGGQQRGGHQQQPPSSGTEEKSISFTVPKTQVIEHITKLITINEAVVDTSEIDSVKPRRSSLSRKSSMESPKFSSSNDPYAFDPKAESPGPSGIRHMHNPEAEVLSSVPLLRSHSLPSSTCQEQPSASRPVSPQRFRLCQSFDEQQAVVAEMRVGHVPRMLRRQPAIEVPLGAEQVLEESSQTSSDKGTDQKRQPKQQLHKTPRLLECEACGSLFQHSEGYESHIGSCPGHQQQPEPEVGDRVKSSRDEPPQVTTHYKFPALAVTVRKRRKEASLEEDPPCTSARTTVPATEELSHPHSGEQKQPDRPGVIQHTSSFEKQESVSMESQESDVRETHQPEPKPSPCRLIRQPNIQVPEILVTLEPDTDMASVSPPASATLPKEAERVEEFQWPQRSQTLAQLPAEKLPPKKKRLRLAEAAQSSGESSFESVSVPRSPSQESIISHTSSISVSLEEPVRSEGAWVLSSQSSQMLMVPSAVQPYQQMHREMRRSASEQTPASHQQTQQAPENRSKSFDYGSLSSQQPSTSWKERRKCLLVKHATLGDPEPEEDLPGGSSPRPGPSIKSHSTLQFTEEWFLPEERREILPSQNVLSLVSRDQETSSRSFSHMFPVATEVLSHPVLHRALFDAHRAELGTSVHPLPPLQFSSRSQALYFPISSGHLPYAPLASSTINRPVTPSPSVITGSYRDTQPTIATCLAQLTPVVSLVVPVRLQTHRPTYASAMYTTLSQILASTRSPEPICTTMVIMSQLDQSKLQRSYLTVPSLEMKTPIPISLTASSGSLDEEGYGPLGAGGSKRMLSPAASLELSTEAQRHQKRVKEEEEHEQSNTGEKCREQGAEKKDEVSTSKLEDEKTEQTQIAEEKTVTTENQQEESQASTQDKEDVVKKEDTRPVSPSYPSLHTSTSVNWCYLNYIKPNPSAQQEPQMSVYASWSVSAHNPNLPGLSTKTALSLLCSKQRHSTETYTMASASQAKDPPAARREPPETQLPITPISVSPVVSGQIKEQPQDEKSKAKPKKDEEAATSKSRESSCVRIFEGGFKSSEEYVYVRGRGRGKYICGECGIRCKKPSMLKKHIRTHTDLRPYVCKHCNFAFKTKGNLTKHMKSKTHGKKCQSVGVSESSLDEPESEETGGSEERVLEEQEEHQFSDVEESEDNDDEEEDEESTTHDDPPSSCSSDTHPSSGGRSTGSRHSQQGTPDRELHALSPGQEPSPRGVWSGSGRKSSPCSRRALFSRRGIKPARAYSPSSESCSPSRSLSPRLELSPTVLSLSPKTELSPPSRHVSPSPERGPSPIRPLSPLRPVSPSCYRSSHSRAPPSPLGLHRRSPGLLPWESPATRRGKEGKSGTTLEGATLPESSLFPAAFRLSLSESYPSVQPADNLFSHLPLHSQQARLPCVMIPIGGIQMVQARPRSHPTTPSSPTSPPMEGSSRLSFDSYWGGTPRTQGLRTPLDSSLASEKTGRTPPQPRGGRTDVPQTETTDSKQYSSSHSAVQTPGGANGTPERGSSPGPALSPALSVAECSSGQCKQPPPGGDVEEGAEHST